MLELTLILVLLLTLSGEELSLLRGVSGTDFGLGSDSRMESLGWTVCRALTTVLVTVAAGSGVVKVGVVGRSGTAGTGWRKGSVGTAATGEASTVCTGATREAERGVSCTEPRCTSSSSCSLKLCSCGSLVSLARGSRPPV